MEIRVTDRSGLAGGSGNAAAAKACAGGGKTASASSGTSALSTYAANRLNQYSNITYQSNSLQPNSLSPSYRRTAGQVCSVPLETNVSRATNYLSPYSQ